MEQPTTAARVGREKLEPRAKGLLPQPQGHTGANGGQVQAPANHEKKD